MIRVIKEATSDYIKIGNKIYPKDMSKYDPNATEKEIADQAKKGYEDDERKEWDDKWRESERIAKEWAESVSNDKEKAKRELGDALRNVYSSLSDEAIEAAAEYLSRGGERNLRETYGHLIAPFRNRKEDRTNDGNFGKGISDKFTVYDERGKELKIGDVKFNLNGDYDDTQYIFVGTDGEEVYFLTRRDGYPFSGVSIRTKRSPGDLYKIVSDDSEFEKGTMTFEELFDKLVPGSGKADTLAGEIVRAWMRVMYRYYNDGDQFTDDEPYAGVGDAESFVYNRTNDEIRKAIDKVYDNGGATYGEDIGKISKMIADFINNNPQLIKISNSKSAY